MAEHQGDEHPHIGPHAHLPDPSIWPLVVGIAFFLVGAAIVWWVRDPDSSFAGPFVGAAVAAALIAVGGWAYEDGKMKRQTEEYEHTGPRLARFTQVITFALADGQFENANSENGVLRRIDASDNDLRNLPGFQDLRIIASPGTDGPSQVLVETTWSDREGLATYDETRQSVLDIVNEFSDQVLPGSVQVFDMVVVRDTKDVAVRFGLGTAATLIGGLAIGGFLIGAGLTLFEGEATVAPPDNGVAPPSGFAETGVIEAGNFYFEPTSITLPPETEVTLTIDNVEGPHNIQIFDGDDDSAPLLTGCIEGCANGDSVRTDIESGPVQQTFTFVTPGPGTYFYHCQAHPEQMTGVMTIEEGAPVPGEGAPAPDNGEPANGVDGEGVIEAGNFYFEPTEFTVAPETEVTLTIDNVEGPHNIEIFDGEDDSAPLLEGCIEGCENGESVRTPLETGPVQQTFTFLTPGPGTYFYHCQAHPDQMTGFMTVEEGGPTPGGGGAPDGDDADEAEGDEADEDEPEGVAWRLVR